MSNIYFYIGKCRVDSEFPSRTCVDTDKSQKYKNIWATKHGQSGTNFILSTENIKSSLPQNQSEMSDNICIFSVWTSHMMEATIMGKKVVTTSAYYY